MLDACNCLDEGMACVSANTFMAVQALREAPDVLERGFLDKFDNFNAGGKDTPSSYTAMLYNSSIIPCPRGRLALSTAQHGVDDPYLNP